MQTEFKPEIELEDSEVASLALVVGQDGYKVIHKLIRHEVDRFILALVNIDSTRAEAVLEGHRVAKTAAQLYDGVTNKINRVVESYYSAKQSGVGIAPDSTEGIIDIGPHATTQEDIDGFEESHY